MPCRRDVRQRTFQGSHPLPGDEGASAILEAVFEALHLFAGPMLEDDATLVVVKAKALPRF